MAIHSKITVVKLDTSGGVLTDISTYCNKVSMPRSLDLNDVTVFGSTSKQYLPGFADGDVSMGGPWTRAQDQFFSPIFAAFQAGTLASVSFEYGPEGADAADVKHSCELIMTDYEPGSDVGNPVEWSAKFKVTGAITVATY